MTRNILMVGISALAFAASAASAQTAQQTDVTDPSTGNRRVISCPDTNTCTVTQGGATTSFGSVTVSSGTNNTSTVNQTGTNQYAKSTTTGSYNTAAQVQSGSANVGNITQTGSGNSTAGTGQQSNSATITQGSSNNVATISQARTTGATNADLFNVSSITQGNNSANAGSNNSATSSQNGTNLSSVITQDDTTNNNRATPANVAGGAVAGTDGTGVAADFNSATVNQSGTGSSSTVNQARRGNVATVNMFAGGVNQTGAANAANNAMPLNVSTIRQTNNQFTLQNPNSTSTTYQTGTPTQANNPRTGNSADVAITGQQNISLVAQDGVQNTARQSMLNGGAGNTGDTTASGSNPGTGLARPGAGTGETGRSQGNSSTIIQSGLGNYANTSIGGRVTTGGGSGNISTITQTQNNAAVTAQTLNGTASATTAHRALMYQRGILDQASITQTNNMLGGAAGNTVQSGAVADVSQLSYNGSVTVNQTGTNTATVTQGARTETTGADGYVSITQVDAGDTTTTSGGSSGGQFGGGTGGSQTTTSQRNAVEVAQYGIQNTATVNQNAVNASATVFQMIGSRQNFARIQQGNGGSVTNGTATGTATGTNNGAFANNLVATVTQSGEAGTGTQTANATRDTRAGGTGTQTGGNAQTRGVDITQQGQNLYASATQAGGTASAGLITNGSNSVSNNAITISQVNSYSSATVNQNGTSLSALVDQQSTFAVPTLQSLVTITQSGTNNGATARQSANAGSSTSGAPTAGMPGNSAFPYSRSGAQAAEIVILQSGSGNSGTVQQMGRGQYARLDQTGGTNNTGNITQNADATNAVAILTQSGTNNSLTINQTAPGQYINVNQTGMGNAMTTTTQSAVTPGGAGGAVTTN